MRAITSSQLKISCKTKYQTLINDVAWQIWQTQAPFFFFKLTSADRHFLGSHSLFHMLRKLW